ncbi:argininosuccinate synthase domain-containing protein [Paenibacillus tarimensis]|uniref:argininosuccinate synthase domain-containing protein n=1 Tax=Paenibacillus tarimensis TaxID=416012 RepID=UPI001F38F71D|nr:argininosuccinate synthase domain-containing protein [Paenibacillus tarimensis]MCF2945176.1 argininosuccinate synthase [Paenibacillus tarimensis]
MGTVLFHPDDLLRFKGEKAVLLFSGGLDSTYAALQLVRAGIEVHALHANVGQKHDPSIQRTAGQIGVYLRTVDVRRELCDRFISKGIYANALYNRYPISSSYTRPLIAEEGVRYAREIGSRLVVHSATPIQNTASRFNMSVFALCSGIHIYCPAILHYISREEKAAYLKEAGIQCSEGIDGYSVDENLWARVFEGGPLESPDYEVPEHYFTWTAPNTHNREPSCKISIGFEEGRPCRLNGERVELPDLIARLNRSLGSYGIGRYNGFESTAFGMKNRELREAPAACLLHESHMQLEDMILSGDEQRVKRMLDAEWTGLVVAGGWFSKLKNALDSAIADFNRDISGEVNWQITEGRSVCVSVSSPAMQSPLHYSAFYNEFKPYSLNSLYQQMSRKHRSQ